MRIIVLTLMGLTLMSQAWADIGQPPGSSSPYPTTLGSKNLGMSPHHISAEACRDCHQEIYQQWSSSMHANSTAIKDPIHGAFYQTLVGSPRQEGAKHKISGKYPICLKCHAPNAALDKKTKLDAMPAYNEGVNCLTCHMMKRYKGVLPKTEGEKMKLGVDAYEMGKVLQAPSGKVFTQIPIPTPPPESNIASATFHPFPMESNTALLRSSDLCLGCHEQRNNPNGVALCNTGAEFREAGDFNCQQCHMPVSQGFADHTMAGGHVQAMLERGVIVTLDTKKDGQHIEAKIKLQNMLPHKMPTGAPFRNMYLKITAYNIQGIPLWQNFKKHPIKEDTKAMFMLKLLDDDDNPAPPPKATKHGEDSRLAPRETRELTYTIPAQNVAVVRAELLYDLLLPSLKNKFQSIPPALKRPRVIARAEQRI